MEGRGENEKSGNRVDIECHGGETPRPRATQLDTFEWVSPLPSAWVFCCGQCVLVARLQQKAES